MTLFLALGGIAAGVLALNVLTGYLEARVRRWEHKALADAEEQHWANAAALVREAERVRRERHALATDVPAPEPAPVRWSNAPSPACGVRRSPVPPPQPWSVGDERAETAHPGPVERPQSPVEPDPVLGDPDAVSRALSGLREPLRGPTEAGLCTDPSCPCPICRAARRLDYGTRTEKRWP